MQGSNVLLAEYVCERQQTGPLQQRERKACRTGRPGCERSRCFLQPRICLVCQTSDAVTDLFEVVAVTCSAQGVVMLAQRPRRSHFQCHGLQQLVELLSIALRVILPTVFLNGGDEVRPASGL